MNKKYMAVIVAVITGMAGIVAIINSGIDIVEKASESNIAWTVLSAAIVMGVIDLGFLLVFIVSIVCSMRELLSPRIGRKLAFLQVIRLCLPHIYLTASENQFKFQQKLVQVGKLVDDHTTIRDRRFKENILQPLMEHIKKTLDDICGADVSIQLKMFPTERIHGLICEKTPFDFFAEPLLPYLETPPNEYALKRPCGMRYRLIKDVEASKLEEESRVLRNKTKDDFCVNSALNTIFQCLPPAYICNDLHFEQKRRKFYGDSPFYVNKQYRSVAMFLISRECKAASEENIPLGVLWIESKSPNRFDNRLTRTLGQYFANRLYYTFKHSLIGRGEQSHHEPADYGDNENMNDLFRS